MIPHTAQNHGLGARLQRAREARGLTLEQLGELLGVQRQAVSRYERGGHDPSAGMLRRLCVALEVSADDLLGLSAADAARTSPAAPARSRPSRSSRAPRCPQ